MTRPPAPGRKTPLWVVIVGVAIGVVVLFAVGFGLSTLVRGGSSSSSAPETSAAPTEESCVTVTVTPSEVLPQATAVKINVYNSTNRVGLAGTTADELRARGFIVDKIDNDPNGSGMTSVGEVRYGDKGAAQAQVIAFYIPGITLVNDGRKGKVVDVALGQQYTALASKQDVDAAMNEPSESASGPGCATPAPTKTKPNKGNKSQSPAATESPAAGDESPAADPSATGEASPTS